MKEESIILIAGAALAGLFLFGKPAGEGGESGGGGGGISIPFFGTLGGGGDIVSQPSSSGVVPSQFLLDQYYQRMIEPSFTTKKTESVPGMYNANIGSGGQPQTLSGLIANVSPAMMTVDKSLPGFKKAATPTYSSGSGGKSTGGMGTTKKTVTVTQPGTKKTVTVPQKSFNLKYIGRK